MGLKIYDAAARQKAFKTKHIFTQDNNYMNNVWSSGECSIQLQAKHYCVPRQPRPQAQPLPLRGYCVENTVGNARSGLAENAEKSV